jgi:putative DNA primase/helicase
MELRARPQWVMWRYEWSASGWTKVPYRDRDRKASSTDARTWHAFDAALFLYQRHNFDGIGYMFSPDDPYCGVDVDKCREPRTGALSTAAATILAELATYSEVSPSDTGVKAIGRATLTGHTRHVYTPPTSEQFGKIELYDRARFFTMTGRHEPSTPATIADMQEAIDALYARLFPVIAAAPASARRAPGEVPADDQIVIEKAMSAADGPLFARLWAGDTSGHRDDDSSADLALCNLLAFWCGPDRTRIDRLFRASGLFRAKWDERRGADTYGGMTIAKALDGRTAYYDWDRKPLIARIGKGSRQENTEDDASTIDPNDYPHTDTGNSRLFAVLQADELRHDHRRGEWLRWRGHWWGRDDDGHARRLTATIAERRAAAAATITDERDRKSAIKWAFQSQAKARRDALLAQSADEHPLTTSGADWDANPFLLGVANGILDLRTGALRPGQPDDRITMHSAVAYDATAPAPRWSRFLTEVFRGDDDLIAWLRRVAGYSLTGSIAEHVAFFCYGSGSNGKSTLLNVLGALMGDYAATTSFTTLERAERNDGSTVELAALAGKRLVTASETTEGKHINEARLKSLTSGDPITARFLYQNPFTFRPVLKLWLAVNHKPEVGDDSVGFWRRVRLIPFLARFEGQAADKGLEDALRAELPGIMSWAVQGCLDWQREGLGLPAAVADATSAYREESDPIAAFLAECCATGDHLIVRANALYKAYDTWAADQGQREKERLTTAKFGRRVGERFEKGRDGNGNFYRGLTVSQAWLDRDR